jgi:hypothetical protein
MGLLPLSSSHPTARQSRFPLALRAHEAAVGTRNRHRRTMVFILRVVTKAGAVMMVVGRGSDKAVAPATGRRNMEVGLTNKGMPATATRAAVARAELRFGMHLTLPRRRLLHQEARAANRLGGQATPVAMVTTAMRTAVCTLWVTTQERSLPANSRAVRGVPNQRWTLSSRVSDCFRDLDTTALPTRAPHHSRLCGCCCECSNPPSVPLPSH